MDSLSYARFKMKISCQYIINMNPGANTIFFNKKIKIGRAEHSIIPHPPTSDNISFLPYPETPRSGRHMCIITFQFIHKISAQPGLLYFKDYSLSLVFAINSIPNCIYY